MSVQVRFATGPVATYESGVGSHVGHYGFRIYFEEATLTSQAAFDTNALLVYPSEGERLEIDRTEFSPEHPVEAELRAWLAALRGEAIIPVPGEEGLATVALAEAAYRSADSGLPVRYEVDQ
jgi:predicted dehydrogenase